MLVAQAVWTSRLGLVETAFLVLSPISLEFRVHDGGKAAVG
jgi:hypothetical protein